MPRTTSIPRRVALACFGQIALVVCDLVTLTVALFGVLGMVTSEPSPSDFGGRIVIGWYLLVSLAGIVLGSISVGGLWTASETAKPIGIVHAIVSCLTCCPFSWGAAIAAVVTISNDEVGRWPEDAKRGDATVADVFR